MFQQEHVESDQEVKGDSYNTTYYRQIMNIYDQ